MQAIDGQAVRDGAMLTGAPRDEGVFRREAEMWVEWHQARLVGNQLGIGGGSLVHVGLDEELTAGRQHAAHLLQ
jgi:hypothetical protein